MPPDPFEYDVALSFAVEDRAAAEDLACLLRNRKIKVFLDECKPGDPWVKDMVDHLVNLYNRKARYCVLFISQYYPLKKWTEAERVSATERALRDADQYILPLRLDVTNVPGLGEASGALDLHRSSLESLGAMLAKKLTKTELHPGPPPESHDLRSGNVPSSDWEEDIE